MEQSLDLFKKLEILTDAAKYDVACTSSGSSRGGVAGSMGNAVSGGICHCFSADGRCISLLKILYTNECVYDCKYCVNRVSRDVPRASFTPEEIAELTISFYRRNYIEGLFLSSGIRKNPDFTMEQIYEAIYLLRTTYHFNGYIHVKAIPGADPLLIEKTGWLVDRMSTNLELPTSAGLKALAPQKSRKTILSPIRQIQNGRKEIALLSGGSSHALDLATPAKKISSDLLPAATSSSTHALAEYHPESSFVPAGQSTQMIIGATGETDFEIVHVAEALYNNFDLKRVFFSAFINTTGDSALPATLDGPPLLREHRLYQADFLLRFYHFSADEIITAERPNLNIQIDPKCNWALAHLEQFPIEVSAASYRSLLRIPGIGVKSAKRIVAARRYGKLDFPDLKKFGVVLKRAMYFITLYGRTMVPLRMNEQFILCNLLGLRESLPLSITGGKAYEQLSLFGGIPNENQAYLPMRQFH